MHETIKRVKRNCTPGRKAEFSGKELGTHLPLLQGEIYHSQSQSESSPPINFPERPCPRNRLIGVELLLASSSSDVCSFFAAVPHHRTHKSCVQFVSEGLAPSSLLRVVCRIHGHRGQSQLKWNLLFSLPTSKLISPIPL
jgi:hypothetical protein